MISDMRTFLPFTNLQPIKWVYVYRYNTYNYPQKIIVGSQPTEVRSVGFDGSRVRGDLRWFIPVDRVQTSKLSYQRFERLKEQRAAVDISQAKEKGSHAAPPHPQHRGSTEWQGARPAAHAMAARVVKGQSPRGAAMSKKVAAGKAWERILYR